MIHKFRDMPENLNLRKNIYVLIDEAHRTNGGDHLEAELDRQITRSNRLRQSTLASAFSGNI